MNKCSFIAQTDRRMIASTVWTMDDHKLVQKSNLTKQQPCKAPITFYILHLIYQTPPSNIGLRKILRGGYENRTRFFTPMCCPFLHGVYRIWTEMPTDRETDIDRDIERLQHRHTKAEID